MVSIGCTGVFEANVPDSRAGFRYEICIYALIRRFRGDLYRARTSGVRHGADQFNSTITARPSVCAMAADAPHCTRRLVGADLSWSRPWEANLYDIQPESDYCKEDGATKRITCVSEVLSYSEELRHSHPEAASFFRGERKKSRELRPFIMRPAKSSKQSREYRESRMLRGLT